MPSVQDSALPHTGELLGGRYRLTERIGAGGMGRVYRARDETLARDVAIKLFYTDPTHDPDALRRASEARVLASLAHPSLVTLYDAHVEGGDHAYLVMELIEGPTLQRRIEDGPLSRGDVASLLRDLASALAAVHHAGIVHRDVKPSNVLLRPRHNNPDGFEAVLADFGVAQLIDATRLTSPGTVIGTAAYLAPEQVRGEPAQATSDVYALGLLTIEALTRLHPFGGGSIQSTVLARLARQPDIPGELGYAWKSLLSAMTAPDPASRPTAADVAVRAAALEPAPGARHSTRRQARAASALDETAPWTVPTLELATPPDVASLPAAATPTAPKTAPRRGRWTLAAAAAVVVAAGISLSALAGTFGAAEGATNTTQVEPAPVATTPAPVQSATVEEPAVVVADSTADQTQVSPQTVSADTGTPDAGAPDAGMEVADTVAPTTHGNGNGNGNKPDGKTKPEPKAEGGSKPEKAGGNGDAKPTDAGPAGKGGGKGDKPDGKTKNQGK